LGVPGTSNAITIAQKLGWKYRLVEKSAWYLNRPERETGALIEELNRPSANWMKT